MKTRRTILFTAARALLSVAVLSGCEDGVSPEDGVPSDAPLGDTERITIADVTYAGAFRLPSQNFGFSDLNYSEGPIDVFGPSLLIVGHSHHQALAEFTIPELVRSETLSDLNMAAAPLQPFVTLLDRAASNPQQIDRIAALARITTDKGVKLFVNAYEYYDAPADNTHTTLVVHDPSDLAGTSVDGFYALAGAAHAGGWISAIPMEWQPKLGSPWITGASSGVPIIGRLSVGPSAFGFDPASLLAGPAGGDAIPTTPLLDYDLSQPLHPDLSNEGQTNGVWTHLSRAVFGFIVPGTRTYLTLGHSGGHGPGGVCYKCTPVGATQACGGYCSVDPADTSLFYWMYDVDDLERVRNGEMLPNEVRPYEYGAFEAPFSTGEMGGGSYDPVSGLLYLSLLKADRAQSTYANPPVIAAFRVTR